MGAYLSEPMTVKQSEDGQGNKIRFGASAMQGWRVSQEDAHNCVAEFDKDSSYFAVYDGHGGAEVAVYLSRHLPDLLKTTEGYSKDDVNEALVQAFLKMDASIKEPAVLAEIQRIAKAQNGEDESVADYEDENVSQLYEEATMPLDKLVAQYTHNGSDVKEKSPDSVSAGPSPGSSREIIFKAAASKSEELKELKEESVDDIAKGDTSPAGSIKATTLDASASSSSDKNIDKPDCGQSTTANVEVVQDVVACNITSENLEAKPTSNGSESEVPAASSDPVIGSSSSSIECVNGEVGSSSDVKPEEKKLTNGVEIAIVVEESTSKPVEVEPSPKPRKGKVHPVPIMMPQESSTKKSLRVSPRKGRNLSNMAFSDSESDLDSSDSDEPTTKQFIGSNSSSSDDDEDCDEEDEDENSEDDSDEEEDDSFLNGIQEPGYDSGCTAVVSFMKWTGDKLNLYVANAGDSRCVVSRNGEALEMSYDHKPESEVEALRIVKAGGKVTDDGRVNGGLNLSRAIGDHSYKQNALLPPEEQMISPLPTIQHVELDPMLDDFIVLACDGIWNSMTSQEVVNFVASRIKTAPSLSKICEELFDACLSPDTFGDGTGCDNMTAIIVQLTKGLNGNKRSRDESEPSKIDDSSKKPKMDV